MAERTQTEKLNEINALAGELICGGLLRLFSCYVTAMAGKIASKDKRRRTTMVPVTTMEEILVLNDEERAALLVSLEKAEAQIKVGDYTEDDRKKFRKRFMRIYRSRQRR